MHSTVCWLCSRMTPKPYNRCLPTKTPGYSMPLGRKLTGNYSTHLVKLNLPLYQAMVSLSNILTFEVKHDARVCHWFNFNIFLPKFFKSKFNCQTIISKFERKWGDHGLFQFSCLLGSYFLQVSLRPVLSFEHFVTGIF